MGVVRWLWAVVCGIAILGVSYFTIALAEKVALPLIPSTQLSGESESLKSFSLEFPPEGTEEIRLIQEKNGQLRKKLIGAQLQDDEISKCIGRITKNWVRVVDDTIIRGFDEDMDFRLKFRLRQRALEGKEICPHAD